MQIIEKEIKILQQVHNYVHNLNIDLPSITVVGPQSSGKSSVLESLINKDILPRGTNLVTRCPIIIHLKRSETEEYVELDNEKILIKKNTDFIKNKILNLMDKICGTDKEISSNPIIIDLWLKDTLEFTIIDLPGITKVAIGNQSPDIEKKILEMVREYILPKNTIILAIINSNVDISNSESLKICKEVDPEYLRTIGVLTKIDLMDKGTNCIDILQNKTFPLRLGYVGIINRSQQDIKNNISLASHKEKEFEFFKNNEYRHCTNTGSRFLLEQIFSLYKNKVKEIFPNLIQDLKNKFREMEGAIYVDSFILRYQYSLVLNKLIVSDIKKLDFFEYDGTNIILDLNIFKNCKVCYDFSMVKTLLATDISIFINDNLLSTVIKTNMMILKDKILILQNQYKKNLHSKINQIFSKKIPDVCKAFNRKILEEIESWNIEIKISDYIEVMSNVIENTDLFYKNSISTNLFGTHLCLKGGSKEEILKDFSKMYLDKQVINIIEYVTKLNYYHINDLIIKTGMISISKVDIESYKDMTRYIEDMVRSKESSQNILKAIRLLENNT